MNRRDSGRLSVAYQGGPGANGETAITNYWKGVAQPVSMRSFPALLSAVADRTTAYGVLPIWNSAIGDLQEAGEALAEMDDRVEQVDEVLVPVRHALLAVAGTPIGAIRAVGSHPAALAQCTRFFGSHPLAAPVAAWDTAGAAVELANFARRGDAGDAGVTPWYAGMRTATPRSLAVIANRAVAQPLGLQVVAEAIQDDPENVTRFAVVQARRASWRW